jgi:beta-glucanase (GH16 family)
VHGFGTGAFDWTTTDDKNVFVDSAGLHIVPTLTKDTTSITDAQIMNGYNLNLTNGPEGDSTCTGTTDIACIAYSNSTEGYIIPPVRSARITTKGKKNIKYGKVEITAKLPQGDWLWPAICKFLFCRLFSTLVTRA